MMKRLKNSDQVQRHIEKLAKRYHKDCCDILSFYGAMAMTKYGKSEMEIKRRYTVELEGLVKKIDEATIAMIRNEW